MTAEQSLFYAAGQIAYSLAMADGKIQLKEKEVINKFIAKEAEKTFSADYADIIFHILEKDHVNAATAIEWAKKSISTSKSWLTDELRIKFNTLLDSIAAAYPPITDQEKDLITEYRSLLSKNI